MPKSGKRQTQIDISGRLEHVRFHNPENHYTIARLRADEGGGRISVVGHLPGARAGARLNLKGRWERHPRWGDQFRFTTAEEALPAEVEEIRAYLASGLIPGLGAKAAALVDHFGAQTLTVLDQSPERISEVRGIGPKTAVKIETGWREHQGIRQLMHFLKENEVPVAHAARLMKAYGDEALGVLRADPYRVAAEIAHFGFEIADRIVQRSALAIPADQRAQACLLHLLERAESRGHCWLPRQHLLAQGEKVFDLERTVAEAALETLAATHEVVVDRGLVSAPEDFGGAETEVAAVYPAFLHHCETQIARQLAALAQLPAVAAASETEMSDAIISRDLAVTLSGEQRAALAGALAARVAVITGGPGTGKTTLIRALAALFKQRGRIVALAAPTGRAARRMGAVTGRKAKTLHRLLAYSVAEGRFRHDGNDPLDLDVLVVDEASMLDLPLFHHLLAALPLTARLILVGDVYQLPSVGPGTVLADLIASGVVPVCHLETVHRQARRSEIVVNAHRIRRGEAPAIDMPAAPEAVDLENGGDFHFIPAEGPADAAARIVALCRRDLPDSFGLDPLADIQVLSPMHRGEVGTLQLNQALQAVLNPPPPGTAAKQRLRTGDKVIQMRNDYTREVFNGEVGAVVDTDAALKRTVVVFEGREVVYEAEALDDLSLAYAISIHKSQGSEYPAVVVPLVTQHYVMLQRNLLYTAMTRGKRLVVLVGSPKALRVALENDRPMQRRTGLGERLRQRLAPDDSAAAP